MRVSKAHASIPKRRISRLCLMYVSVCPYRLVGMAVPGWRMLRQRSVSRSNSQVHARSFTPVLPPNTISHLRPKTQCTTEADQRQSCACVQARLHQFCRMCGPRAEQARQCQYDLHAAQHPSDSLTFWIRACAIAWLCTCRQQHRLRGTRG